MLGKSIKPPYGPAKYGESLIVVCFVSDAALILPSYFLSRAYRV
ncbi:putative membrane protein [Anaplasma phagocytophilum str. ApNP]|uniref:Putative membrane protein n=1 Tax=Anaplasma phagocytophilum str. ApNP TaxID=1359153 RepID=A0A0F3NI35_ANAPH|nr:putative membrane protein [Anaplasma phagocytophilum str. ApNP]